MNARRLPLRFGVMILLALASAREARSQVVPATSEKFTTRAIGGGGGTGSASVGFTPAKPQTTARTST